MSEVSILDVIAILVGVSVFTTGFLSVRMHAKRDRALARSELIKERLERSSKIELFLDQRNAMKALREELENYAFAHQVDPIARWTVWGNVGVFLLVLFLAALIVINNQWRFTLNVFEVTPMFWALAAVLLVEFGVVALGIADLRFIRNALYIHLNQSPFVKLSNGLAAIALGRHGEAVHYFDDILQSNPTWNLALILRGEAYKGWGYEEQESENYGAARELLGRAKADFNRSINIYDTVNARVKLAEVTGVLGDAEQALQQLTRLIDEYPNDAAPLLWRGVIHEKLGRTEEARRDYQTARSKDPDYVEEAMQNSRGVQFVRWNDPRS